jgi:hypothetical protein
MIHLTAQAPANQLLRRQSMPPRDRRHVVAALITLGKNLRQEMTALEDREPLNQTLWYEILFLIPASRFFGYEN